MKERNLLLFLLAVGVFGILNTEMGIIGVLPMVAERYQVDIVQAGLLVSLFALGVAIAGPTMPLLFSRFNRKKVMLLVLGIFTLCNVISVFAPDFNILLAARIIPAFFHPVYCALAFSIAASSVPQGEAPRSVAQINMGVAAGMVVGVPISHFLGDVFSLSAAMSFFAIVTGLMFFLTFLFIPDMPAGKAMSYGSQLQVLKRPAVWLSMAAIAFLNGSVFGVYNYSADYLDKVAQTSGEGSTFLLIVYGLSNVSGSYVGGRLLSKIPSLTIRVLPISIILLYGIFLSARITYMPLLLFLIIIWGLAAGINANVNQYRMARATPDAPDFGNGLFLTSANLGCMAATSFCGIFINHFGIAAVMWGGCIFSAMAGLLFFARSHIDLKRNIAALPERA